MLRATGLVDHGAWVQSVIFSGSLAGISAALYLEWGEQLSQRNRRPGGLSISIKANWRAQLRGNRR